MKNEIMLREIRTMFDKILAEDVTYDTDLANIVCKYLEGPISLWCSRDSRLKGKQLETEILNDTYLIISKKIVTHFLRKDGMDAPVNDDEVGFSRWMRTVAKRRYLNVADREGRRDHLPIDPPEDDEEAGYAFHEPSTSDDNAELDNQRDLISAALDVVLDKKSEMYIVLAWLAVSFHVLENNVQNHIAIREVVDTYSDKSLFEVRDAVFSFTDKSDYFCISAQKKAEIDANLNTLHEDGRRKGDLRWEELYINNNGRGTLSRWVSRMNEHIRQRLKDNGSSNS